MRWDSPIRVMNWKDSAIQNTVIQNVKQPGKSDTRGVLVSGAVNFTMAENTFNRNGASGAVYCLEK